MFENETVAAECGGGFGAVPGCIMKHVQFHKVDGKDRVGGVYPFTSIKEIEDYLNGEFWKKISGPDAFPWADVVIEAYEVTGTAEASGGACACAVS